MTITFHNAPWHIERRSGARCMENQNTSCHPIYSGVARLARIAGTALEEAFGK
jgi:hypothetical protein